MLLKVADEDIDNGGKVNVTASKAKQSACYSLTDCFVTLAVTIVYRN